MKHILLFTVMIMALFAVMETRKPEVKIVRVPEIREVVRYEKIEVPVEKVVYRDKVVRVPEIQYVEKIVRVPEVRYIDRMVDRVVYVQPPPPQPYPAYYERYPSNYSEPRISPRKILRDVLSSGAITMRGGRRW